MGKHYYFCWIKKVNRTPIVDFTLKIETVPQQELSFGEHEENARISNFLMFHLKKG